MAEIMQKVSRSMESICPKCFHHPVCVAIGNQPCFECNQFVEVVRCKDCKKGKTMREKLVELIQKTGMVENKNRCNIIAEELIANGVIVLDEKDVTLTVTRNVGEIEPDYEAEDV